MRNDSKPVLHEKPEHCPGAYVFYAYCKYQHPGLYEHGEGVLMEEADQVQTYGEAVTQFRKDGWIFHRDGTATCGTCAKSLSANSQGTK